MTFLSVVPRKTPEGAGDPKPSNKLFFISPKTASFLESLGNSCIHPLLMLYYECRRLNGLWSPLGIETLMLSNKSAREI